MNPRLTRFLESLMVALAFMANMPYTNGAIADILPPKWKGYIGAASVISAFILSQIKSAQAASKSDIEPGALK